MPELARVGGGGGGGARLIKSLHAKARHTSSIPAPSGAQIKRVAGDHQSGRSQCPCWIIRS
jgi:hypothetical protein